MRASLRIIGVLLALGLGLLIAVPAQAATIVVTPQTVQPGGTVTVSGNVLVPPDDHLPGELAKGDGTITLFSNAFPGGTASVPGSVDVTVWGEGTMYPGSFTGPVGIRSDAASGDYTVTGRFAGGNVGVVAQFTVAGAATSPEPSAQPTAPQPSAQPTAPPTGQPGSPAATQPAAVQLPGWWPAALAGLLVLVLSPWVGIALLWRRRPR